MKNRNSHIAALVLGFALTSTVSAQDKHAAEKMKQDMEQLSSQVEQYIELSVKCFQETQKEKVDSCTINGLNKLVDKGSYVAEHALGNYYENKGDKAKAIEFYHKALKNPKLSSAYKPEVQKDLERAQK